jgi:TonB-dependent SusC/RagA subfamily outer membrane receptor
MYTVALTLLVALGAWATERLLCVWRLPRRAAGALALSIALATPVMVATRTPPPADSPRNEMAAAVPLSGNIAIAPQHAAATIDVRQPPLEGQRRATILVERVFVGLWLVSSAVLFVWVFLCAARLRRERGGWREVQIEQTRLLVSTDRGPAVIGFLRPRIVLPEWVLSLDARARALVLRHELEHVRAGDAQLLLFATLVPFVLPWNLPLWFIARRLKLAVELDCDDRVLRCGGEAHEYGLLLLEIGGRHTKRLDFGAAYAARRSFLARRISTMIADKPRRSVRGTIGPVLGIACLTLAAARIPRPEPIRVGSTVRHVSRSSTDEGSAPVRHAAASVNVREVGREAVSTTALPRQAAVRPRSPTAVTPLRITVDWENAPIEDVAAAFAKYTGRKITVASGVTTSVTVHIVDQPWDEALAHIAIVHGLRLQFNPDSSIVIVAAAQQIRRVSGRVIDDSTGTPIAGAEIQVIGLQAVGEPNRVCTMRDGTFALNVPDDSVHLEASAPGYQFAHAIVAPRDTAVVFRGRGTGEHVTIESVEVVKGAAAASLYGPGAANGAVVVTTGRDKTITQLGGGFFFIRGQPVAGRPLLIIDGVPVTADILVLTGVCVGGR